MGKRRMLIATALKQGLFLDVQSLACRRVKRPYALPLPSSQSDSSGQFIGMPVIGYERCFMPIEVRAQ